MISIEARMAQREKSGDSLAWVLLRTCFFFLLGIATPLSLIGLIIHFAANGLYSFSTLSAIFLTILILWLSSPLILFFAYAVWSLRDRLRRPIQKEASATVSTAD
jgi:cytochrome c biogenesis protein CcdA